MYRVLIVEDDPMVAMINEKYVARNPNFTVVAKVGDGAAALEFLRENRVDLVVLDAYMPRVDGLETLRSIRENKTPTDVVMVTAANDAATVEEALRLGALDYLVKPFSADRLSEALEKFIAQTETLKANRSLDQREIDRILDAAGKKTRAESSPPKGIREETVELILDILRNVDGWTSGEEAAQKAALSSVTARRYLNWLAENGQIRRTVNYETGGRPRMLYRL